MFNDNNYVYFMVEAGEVDNSIGAWVRDPHWNVNYFSVFRLIEGDFYRNVCRNF